MRLSPLSKVTQMKEQHTVHATYMLIFELNSQGRCHQLLAFTPQNIK